MLECKNCGRRGVFGACREVISFGQVKVTRNALLCLFLIPCHEAQLFAWVACVRNYITVRQRMYTGSQRLRGYQAWEELVG